MYLERARTARGHWHGTWKAKQAEPGRRVGSEGEGGLLEHGPLETVTESRSGGRRTRRAMVGSNRDGPLREGGGCWVG